MLLRLPLFLLRWALPLTSFGNLWKARSPLIVGTGTPTGVLSCSSGSTVGVATVLTSATPAAVLVVITMEGTIARIVQDVVVVTLPRRTPGMALAGAIHGHLCLVAEVLAHSLKYLGAMGLPFLILVVLLTSVLSMLMFRNTVLVSCPGLFTFLLYGSLCPRFRTFFNSAPMMFSLAARDMHRRRFRECPTSRRWR